MLPIEEIQKFAEEEKKNVLSVTHDFSHLKRVADAAVWFVKVLDGDKQEQDIAYVAGLLHDIVRPPNENQCHAKLSAKKSKEILKQLGVEKEIRDKIILAVKDYRLKVEWQSPSHQAVYLADKIFEQMGAYVAFRRCMYVGESDDYQDKPIIQMINNHFKKRIERIPKTEFPERFSKLIDSQWKWLQEIHEAIKSGQEWAVSIAKQMYDFGKAHNMTLEEAIRKVETVSEEDERYKQEALGYIEGKKWKDFEKLV